MNHKNSQNNQKKRELLGDLNGLINKLVGISGDVAKLEFQDNTKASKRVRLVLIELKTVDIPAFQEKIQAIYRIPKEESIS